MVNVTWSHSGLKAYEQCPRQYHEVTVLKSFPRGDTVATLYGKELHTAAEKYVRDGEPLPKQFEFMQDTLDALIANVEKGGEVVILGVYAKNPTVNMFFLGEHELNVFGSMMYRHEDYVEAAALISEGRINLDPLVSRHFPFEKYLDAYQYLGENADKTMKVMVDL